MKDENSLSTFWAAAVSSRPAGVLHSLSYVAFLEELLMLLIAQNVMFWMPEEIKTKKMYILHSSVVKTCVVVIVWWSVTQTGYREHVCLKSTRSSNNLNSSFFTQHSICTINCLCGKYYLKLLYEVESVFQFIRCLIKTLKWKLSGWVFSPFFWFQKLDSNADFINFTRLTTSVRQLKKFRI